MTLAGSTRATRHSLGPAARAWREPGAKQAVEPDDESRVAGAEGRGGREVFIRQGVAGKRGLLRVG